MAEEEIRVLSEIFCFPGEFVHWRSGDLIHVHVSVFEQPDFVDTERHKMKICFDLPSDYPSYGLPEIKITSSFLPEDFMNETKEKMQKHSLVCRGCPMLMELIELAKEELNHFHDISGCCQHLREASLQEKSPRKETGILQSCSVPDSKEKEQVKCLQKNQEKQKQLWMTLIQLDHMRSKSKYTKIIKNWAKDFNLCGRLIFCQRLILILLFGDRDHLKAYLVQHKTVCVDVDSKGQNCKERMMTILTEQPCPEGDTDKNIGFLDFQVVEFSRMSEVENLFQSAQLVSIYKKYVIK